MMRSWTLVASVCMAVMLAPSPAGADEPPGQISDIAGDANGLNNYGIEQDTRPVSYDPADLVGVRIETAYESVPRPGGGVRREPTALVIRFRTTATPTVPDAPSTVVYRVETMIDGTLVHLETLVSREEAGGPIETLPLIHEEEMCPQGIGFCNVGGHEEWTAEIVDGGMVVTYPFDALNARQAELIGPGSVLGSPAGWTVGGWILAGAAGTDIPTLEFETGKLIDGTASGADFVVGSDVSQDAP